MAKGTASKSADGIKSASDPQDPRGGRRSHHSRVVLHMCAMCKYVTHTHTHTAQALVQACTHIQCNCVWWGVDNGGQARAGNGQGMYHACEKLSKNKFNKVKKYR